MTTHFKSTVALLDATANTQYLYENHQAATHCTCTFSLVTVSDEIHTEHQNELHLEILNLSISRGCDAINWQPDETHHYLNKIMISLGLNIV